VPTLTAPEVVLHGSTPYLAAMRATERDWIVRLAERLTSKELAWPSATKM